ncbi:MAG: mannose-1-phosphate guanylyltransferase [Pelagibacteraceae bacterium]|nr:mannose-1-phosphate guanylyltransferase [Pelagibacteraceae bacterium]|tara:strand:- start:1186 stop:1977 length:792 start_codon:yes stop_codon:yes gene_type:complete
MKAILLAAGLGTRLKPLTDNWPKCLMPINKKPLLEYWLDSLIKSGVKEILINLHYFPKIVESFVKNSLYKDHVIFSEEKELLGTAGTIVKNKKFITNSKILLIHADNLCICSLKKFIDFHDNLRPKETKITMMTFNTKKPKDSGIVVCNNKGIVQSFYEKSEKDYGDLANAAVYMIEPSVLNWIVENNLKDFSTEVLPNFMNRISTWHNNKVLRDIGSLEELLKAQYDVEPHKDNNSYYSWEYNDNFIKICEKVDQLITNEKK